MTASITHTLSIASVNLILFAARQRGAEANTLAQAVGITTEQLRDPDGRVSIRQMPALWKEVV